MFHAYVLQNKEGILYKGFTSDLKKRIEQHNAADSFKHWTKNKGPWKLIYCEEFFSSKEARKRESFFKTGKGREFLKGHMSASADG